MFEVYALKLFHLLKFLVCGGPWPNIVVSLTEGVGQNRQKWIWGIQIFDLGPCLPVVGVWLQMFGWGLEFGVGGLQFTSGPKLHV